MPTSEHVEALARVIAGARPDDVPPAWSAQDARAILAAIATPGPAQEAVLAALVEGGRLVEEARTYIDGGRAIGHRLVEAEWRTP